MTTGQRIRAARKKAGLTQKELGEKLGVTYQTLAQWENDLRNPKYGTLRRISCALGVAVEALIEGAQQSLAKLDRSRWEGCKFCDREIYIRTTQYLRPALAPATHVEELRCRLADLTGEVYLEAPKKYCPFCGRPLTEEAWAELERRIGGNDETVR